MNNLLSEWKQEPERSIRIVAFGSSNTELFWHSNGRNNWVDWLNINLRENVGRHVSVMNQGVCKETSADLLMRIDRDVISFNPSAVIVTIAGNDAAQRIPTAQYSDNLRQICGVIRSHGALPILQTYYCPMYHEAPAGYRPVFEDMIEINRAIADEMKLPLIDQYKYFEPFYRIDQENYCRLMRDWLHVNHIGNLIMGSNACKAFGLQAFPVPQDIEEETMFLFGKMQQMNISMPVIGQ